MASQRLHLQAALLARHLENNVLGDEFDESSFVIEPVHHLELLEPELLLRQIESLVAETTGRPAPAPAR